MRISTKDNKVRELRENKGMTQSGLAEKAGVSERTINNIEQEKSCRMETIRGIMRGLGVSFNERARIFPKMKTPPRIVAKQRKKRRDKRLEK